MKRRLFLLGSGALIAAPAVIRLAKLMPIVALTPEQTFGPNGVLTGEMLAAEFSRQLKLHGARAGGFAGVAPGAPLTNRKLRQIHIDSEFSPVDMKMSLEDFSARLIAPQAKKLAQNFQPGEKIVSGLLLPYNVMAAGFGRYDGIETRHVADYYIGVDKVINRFDILIQKA